MDKTDIYLDINKSILDNIIMDNKLFYNNLQQNKDNCFPLISLHKSAIYSIHSHDFSELVIITKGNASHIVENEEYYVEKGDIFVIKGNIKHGYYQPSDDFSLCNVIYRRNQLLEKEWDLKQLAGFQTLFILEPYFRSQHQFKSKLHLKETSFKFVEKLTKEMKREFDSEGNNYKIRLETYFRTILIFLAEQFVSNTGKTNLDNQSTKLIKLAKTIAYIEKNYLKPITLKTLAQKASLSERHFTRIFKENYNTTPIDYIINLRIKHSCKLLKNTNYTISDVAIESGFTDSSYFSRCFKKVKGLSPRRYRKRY